MYNKSARFYDAIYDFVDYEHGSTRLRALLEREAPHARTLLDVACGTGRHLEHLREWYVVEGLDLDSQLLDIARERCSGVLFTQGSMLDFQLDRRFDVITCLFSAIGFVKDLEKMRQATATMARHLEPGGLLVIEPWFEPDRYWTGTITANHYDSTDQKICWMYTSKREDDVSVLDIHYLVGTPERVQHLVEEHRVGLFSKEQHRAAMVEAGLVDVRYDEVGLVKRGMHLGRKPRD